MNYRSNALPKRQPRFWCEVIVICIVVLLAWLIEAWGHGEGKCLTDVDGNVPLSGGGWVKVTGHLEGADLDGYAHGHRSQYYDKNGIPTTLSTSFFNIADNNEFYANCPPAPPPPEPPPPTTPRPPPNPTPSPQQQFSIVVISGPGSGAPGDTLTFVVEVRENGSPASGQTVDFSITSGDGKASLGTPNPATTGNDGQAEIELTLGDSASGSYTIRATSNGVSVSATATVEDSQTLPTPAFSIRVVTSPGSGEPGDTLTFVVEVREDGTAVSGQTVDFSITSGDANASLGSASETTGSNGQAQTILTLENSASGSYTITATSNSKSVTGTATVQTSPPPPTYTIHVISGPGSGAPGSQLTFVVEVRENGSPASGQTVTFSITSGDGNASLGSASETTGSNGQAQTTLILGSSASGSYTIRATSNGVSMSATATVEDSQTLPTPAFSIRVVTSPGSGAPGEALPFIVEVQQDGTAKEGETVDFSITSGDGKASLGTPNPATTGNDGQAEIELTLGDSASGSYTITATSNSKSVTGTATVEDSQPAFSIRVVTSPGSGEPGDTLTFAVEVQQDGTLTQGLTVDFSITSGDGNASLGSASETTGSNGQAQTTLILGSNASGSYTIRATSNGVSVSGTATVQTSPPPPPPPPPEYSIRVVTSPGSGEPGDTLTFAVEVQQDGTLTQGLTVTFSVSPNNGTASLSPISATTDSNGQAQTALTLGNSASGSYTITATSNGVSVSATATVEDSQTLPTPAFSIRVVTSPGSGEPGDTLTFAAEVQQDGTLTQGLTVDFSITSGDGNATLNTTSTTTDSNGQAQTALTLGNSASGSYTITATSNGVSVSATATVEDSQTLPTPAFSIRVVTSPGSGEPGDTLTFVVEVLQDGSLTEDLTVDFSITSGDGNATLSPTSTTTDSNGQTQTTLTLGNSASGSYTITATSNGVSVSATATVEGSQPAFSIRVVSSPGSGEPGDTLTFVVEVQQDGTLTQGLTVDFSITSGDENATLNTTSTTTDSNGQAQTTLTLGSSASGSYTITATSNGASVSATATVETEDDNNGNGNGNGGENNGGNNQEPDIPQRDEPESDEDRRFMFQLSLYAGWNFVHIPLEVTQVNGESMSIETLGNLFQVLMPANMYVHDGSCWMEVFGDSTQGLGTTQGVVVYMDAPKTVNLVGSPLPTSFSLERGMNFVGLPRQSADLQKVSDFLAFYPDVCAVLIASEGELYLVGRAGDSGDVEITGGQAFGIISVEQYMTSFGGAAWGKVFVE